MAGRTTIDEEVDLGDRRLLRGIFDFLVNDTYTPTDPTTVSIRVRDPKGRKTTYTWAGGQVTKVSTGRFEMGVTFDQPGMWVVGIYGLGAVTAAATRNVWVRPTSL